MNKEELKSYLEPYEGYIISHEYICYGLDYMLDSSKSHLITFSFTKREFDKFMVFLNDLLFLLNMSNLILVNMRKPIWMTDGFIVQCKVYKRSKT